MKVVCVMFTEILKILLTITLKMVIYNLNPLILYQVYLCRQQERGLMQKARRLMDENSVSF